MFVLSCLCFVTNSCMIEYIKIRLCMMKICLKIAAVLGSYFRIKNGAHTTLTLIPNCIKSILELFFIVKEMIWLSNWKRKLVPLSSTFNNLIRIINQLLQLFPASTWKYCPSLWTQIFCWYNLIHTGDK